MATAALAPGVSGRPRPAQRRSTVPQRPVWKLISPRSTVGTVAVAAIPCPRTRPCPQLRRATPRLPARVAQLRPVTGGGDPLGGSAGGPHGDLEVPQPLLSLDPHASAAAVPLDGTAAADASAGAVVPSPQPTTAAGAADVARVVEHVVARHRLEALWDAVGSSSGGSSSSSNEQPAGNQVHHQQQHDRLHAPGVEQGDADLHVPLLGAAASAPVPQQPQSRPQQQPPQSGSRDAAAPGEPSILGGGIPRSIFVLSLVSMALTSASCVFNTLLPIYMVTELRMTMRAMGMFEGLLEAFSYVVRMFSGIISDRMTSRKAAIAAGFFMGAGAKLGMSFATTAGQLFITKAVDRLGNGVQAAPRDALIGDLSPAKSRSACFGFAQSMRKWGSFMGAGLAFALMKASGNNYQAIFLLASAVSAASALAFVLFVPSHPNVASHAPAAAAASTTLTTAAAVAAKSTGGWLQTAAGVLRDVRSMGVDFWRTLSVITLYGAAHINESLLEARAIEVGFGKAESTLVVALLCLSVSVCAYPLGRLDDKHGHATSFLLGMAALAVGDMVLLLSGTWPGAVFAACVVWGAHWAVVQGPMLSAVVGMAPPHLKGTAFGIFYTAMALVAVLANSCYGALWHAHGAATAFGASAAVVAVAMVATPLLLPQSAKRGRAHPQQQQQQQQQQPPASGGFTPAPA